MNIDSWLDDIEERNKGSREVEQAAAFYELMGCFPSDLQKDDCDKNVKEEKKSEEN